MVLTLSDQSFEKTGREGKYNIYVESSVKDFVKEVLRINSTAHSRHQKDVLIKKAAGDALLGETEHE